MKSAPPSYDLVPIEFDDYPFLIELYAAKYGRSPTVEQLMARDKQIPDGAMRRRLVAKRPDGERLGVVTLHKWPSWPPRRYEFTLFVAPEHQGRGIGWAMADFAESELKQLGADDIYVDTREEDERSTRFAIARGYVEKMRLYESHLDLAAADLDRFQGLIDKLQSEGIRFVAFADTPQDEQDRRDLHAINILADADIPGEEEDSPRTFEEFEKAVFPAFWFWPEGQLLAYDGSLPVGLSAVGEATKGTISSLITGVRREYRGRGIGLALKVLALRVAKKAGYIKALAENATTNAGMIRINETLGYVKRPGMIWFLRTLGD